MEIQTRVYQAFGKVPPTGLKNIHDTRTLSRALMVQLGDQMAALTDDLIALDKASREYLHKKNEMIHGENDKQNG